MDDKNWLLADCNARCTLAYLKALAQEVPDGYAISPRPTARKADIISWIEKCRRSHWDAQTTSHTLMISDLPPKKSGARKSRRVRADLCEITATEVNAFLRTLPEGITYG